MNTFAHWSIVRDRELLDLATQLLNNDQTKRYDPVHERELVKALKWYTDLCDQHLDDFGQYQDGAGSERVLVDARDIVMNFAGQNTTPRDHSGVIKLDDYRRTDQTFFPRRRTDFEPLRDPAPWWIIGSIVTAAIFMGFAIAVLRWLAP